MQARLHSIQYGRSEIAFHLQFKKRKTLAIHVYPDSSVVVDAPANSSLEKIKTTVTKRAKWIKKQQRHFDRYPSILPARKYVSGEAFRYLGRQYTLEIKRSIINEVKLSKGKILVSTVRTNPKYIKALIDSWFRNCAKALFDRLIQDCARNAKKIGIDHDINLQIRTMKRRWGSCSRNRKITLNPELIGAHKECIEYVIVHELCHLKEHNHGKEFYNLLTSVMPDWKRRKEKLEITMEHRSLEKD